MDKWTSVMRYKSVETQTYRYRHCEQWTVPTNPSKTAPVVCRVEHPVWLRAIILLHFLTTIVTIDIHVELSITVADIQLSATVIIVTIAIVQTLQTFTCQSLGPWSFLLGTSCGCSSICWRGGEMGVRCRGLKIRHLAIDGEKIRLMNTLGSQSSVLIDNSL